MNQGFWVAKGNDGEMAYDDSSRIELKRSQQQWFVEGHPEVELVPNKKQAIEVPNGVHHPFSGMLNTSACVSPWSSTPPGFHSWLYEPETAKTVGFDGSGKMNLERKVEEDSFGNNDSSFGLSMPHALDDPRSSVTYGGLRKVKVSEVKDSENPMFVSIGQAYSRDTDNDILSDNRFMSADQTFNKVEEESSISTSHAFNSGHSFNNGESTIISFGGYDDDRLVSSYELLMAQKMEEMNEKKIANSNAEVLTTSHLTNSVAESVSKKKDDNKFLKKTQPNNFPSNVRSLLSTGMLDGVPVKYVAWSKEKELHGVIKGAGYLCGCQSCNFTKVINAYEFERHADCKTKHPNNHIYFENGKTVYGIVQELRSTPQNMLFDAIQTITGSPINQKSFRLWKESFLAATRELQRIYGTDEGKKQFS
ncbi:hypothetical protein F8388_025170 [Cannabis sativa]|uniref:Tify domain-containing protein n=1 Tax=Cannabis sativa TaxID=3483 RepID=A0A7J6FRY0_CANSA|nr:hypothetical protein F8388_025170 [Cannabis sativa]